MLRKRGLAIRRSRNSAKGFSLVELLVVLSVALVVLGIGFMNIPPALRDARVRAGYNTTLMAMRRAREASITQRRVYIVTFTAPRHITVAPQTAATDALNLSLDLPSDIAFNADPGIPTAGPEGLGGGSSTGAIDFNVRVGSGGSNVVYFGPDGSARDQNGNINDGVAYIGRPGELMSSRAITLRGLTGRIRGWRISKSSGVTKWNQL